MAVRIEFRAAFFVYIRMTIREVREMRVEFEGEMR